MTDPSNDRRKRIARLMARMLNFRPPFRLTKALAQRLFFVAEHPPFRIAIDRYAGFKIAYRHGTVDEAVIRESFCDDIFFKEIANFYSPGEADVMIDVGAHIGTFSLVAARLAPRGRIYAVEASQETFNLLEINAALNRAENVFPCKVALADQVGTCRLFHDSGNWGHSIVDKRSEISELVECCTLERFMGDKEIEVCHLIKFNCECAEFPILLNTSPAVLKRIERMLILYHCDLWKRDTEADLLQHLQRSGFSCRVINRSENRGWIIANKAAA